MTDIEQSATQVDFSQLGREDGEDRARAVAAYSLGLARRGEFTQELALSFYEQHVVKGLAAKEYELRISGATDSEIIEFTEAALDSMKALLDDGSNYIANGLAAGAGNRHDRRVARAKGRKSRAHLKVVK
jgi:hypothetical protein